MRLWERSNPMSNVVWIGSARGSRRTLRNGVSPLAETDFEFALERMFADAPQAPDTPLFVARVSERLDRGWSTRRMLIGVMGVAGGLVGGLQMMGSGALAQLHAMMSHADAYLSSHYGSYVPPQLGEVGLGLNTGTLFMLGALAVVSAGLGLARFIREI
jgi:hypothetical protein